MEAESNTSTMTLRVVGGDEKGSLRSETVKYCGVAPKGPLLTNGYASSIGFIGNDGTFT
jgi:hypothetical protein